MRNYFFSFLTILFFQNFQSQEISTQVVPDQDTRVITTGVPFLLIASDARAAVWGIWV